MIIFFLGGKNNLRFRREFPAGFLGPQAVKDLCANIMTEKESEAFAPIIFGYICVMLIIIIIILELLIF